ncbi:hypothetical protein KDA_64050 [Dictyobacter alpinus]|uniref:Uncharacterized protein n=1 Tax=Dictyobacter alpinus TaxID=2014873 RepID=A0A402BHN1_9CHLR|nr:hypothetical protein KDA_64050 [Dictyobacter alpinus]
MVQEDYAYPPALFYFMCANSLIIDVPVNTEQYIFQVLIKEDMYDTGT